MLNVGTQTLETERLILRKFELSDAELVYKNWTSDPLVTKHLSWDVHKSLDDTIKYVNYICELYNKEYCFDWIVVLKETNEPIGEISSVKTSKKHSLIELGYCYGSKYWNKGYATEVLQIVIKYLRETAKVEKITACHLSINPASGKVMKKAGMIYDATLKEYRIDKNTNKRVDLVYYSTK